MKINKTEKYTNDHIYGVYSTQWNSSSNFMFKAAVSKLVSRESES